MTCIQVQKYTVYSATVCSLAILKMAETPVTATCISDQKTQALDLYHSTELKWIILFLALEILV